MAVTIIDMFVRLIGMAAMFGALVCAASAVSSGLSASSAVKRGDTGTAVLWGIATAVCASFALRAFLAARKALRDTSSPPPPK